MSDPDGSVSLSRVPKMLGISKASATQLYQKGELTPPVGFTGDRPRVTLQSLEAYCRRAGLTVPTGNGLEVGPRTVLVVNFDNHAFMDSVKRLPDQGRFRFVYITDWDRVGANVLKHNPDVIIVKTECDPLSYYSPGIERVGKSFPYRPYWIAVSECPSRTNGSLFNDVFPSSKPPVDIFKSLK